jgi:hypothetical protein
MAQQLYNLMASFVHGNSLGVVLEPRDAADLLNDDERKKTWKVCIGPLLWEAVEEAYPAENFNLVVNDLVQFCKQHGFDCGFRPKRKKKA